MRDLRLELSDEELKVMSKEKIKEKVKKACKEAAFQFLKDEQRKVVKKMGKIQYSDLSMQKYLTSNEMNSRLKKLAFKTRMRMVKVAKNYGLDKLCPLCKDDPVHGQVSDSQEHLLLCPKLKEGVKEQQEGEQRCPARRSLRPKCHPDQTCNGTDG